MNVREFVSHTDSEHKIIVVSWVALAVAVGFLPMLFAFVGFKILDRQPDYSQFFIHGEAAIYSLGLLLGIFSLTQKDMRVVFPLKRVAVSIGIILIMLSSAVYAFVAIASLNVKGIEEDISIDRAAVYLFSFVAYLGSVLLGAYVTWAHVVREHLNLIEVLRSGEWREDLNLHDLLKGRTMKLASDMRSVKETDDE